jgi:flagella basal body P-ring formation protein FlgA
MPPTQRSSRRLPANACAAALLALALPTMAAGTRAGEAVPDTTRLRHWIEQSAAATWSAGHAPVAGGTTDAAVAATPAMRVEVSVGRLDAGPKLAACARMEPFLPPNARLWGRTHIGVRCVEGASWSTYVPVTVSVFGPALVADLPLPAGAVADPASFRIEEVDLTTVRGLPLSEPASLAGRTLVRPLNPGTVVRASDLRVAQTVAAGDPVRIRVIGQGFTISSEGFAVAGAGEGQTLRVRTGQGKLLVGTVRERVVEVRL